MHRKVPASLGPTEGSHGEKGPVIRNGETNAVSHCTCAM